MARKGKKRTALDQDNTVDAIDLTIRDLSILEEIYRQESISGATKAVRLSQPSISLRLSRLRAYFNDPLFVRSGQRMLPTPRMTDLIPAIRQALGLFDGSLGREAGFDPAQTDRIFRMCLSDVAQITVLPKLIERLRSVAPSVRLDIIPFDSKTPELLEAGKIDIAVGVFRLQLAPTLFQQTLGETEFVCVCRLDHPRIGDHITLDAFACERHAAVIYQGRDEAVFDPNLRDAGLVPEVAVRLPSSLMLGEVVEASDLLTIIPRVMAELLVKQRRTKIVALPLAMPSYPINQYWPARYHRDPANIWLRKLILSLLSREASDHPAGPV